jgi:uncharacterized DUF497 family protein
MADFDWDSTKESLNVLKHGIDFTTASLIWEKFALERVDNRRDYGEPRYRGWHRTRARPDRCVYATGGGSPDHFGKESKCP